LILGYFSVTVSGVTIARHFHGWKISSLSAAVDVLTRDWVQKNRQGPLDLRGCLILVPTRHAGRRLRAEMARIASEKGTAVLSGSIVTPEHLVPLPPETAPDSLVLALLARRLLDEHAAFPALFPALQTDWSFPFALGIASQLQDVRRQLADGDHSAADLAALVPDEERERWTDIAKLEKGLLRDLAKLGLLDPLNARREAARRPPAAPLYSRIISLFVPDLSALAVRTLDTLSASCDVQLHVLAPESEADRFDTWGRPRPDRWENAPLPLAESQIHVFEQTPDETGALSSLLLEADQQSRALAVCTPDPDTARALARGLQIAGHPLYLPNGVPLSATAPGRLLAAWLALLRQPTYAATAAFLRHPDAQDWITLRLGLDHANDLLSELDRCQARHLPVSFDDLLHFAGQFPILLRALEELKSHAEASLSSFLADLYDCRNPAPAAPPDPLFAEAAKGLAALIQATEETVRRLRLGKNDAIDLLQAALPREQVFPKPDPAAPRETLGWLEVQWETSPALLLADMREGVVPETRVGDAFLPDSLRARAGLAGNRESFARDLYLARALLESRAPGGVRFLYSRRAANQDPQLPSRLLLACPDDELSARVALLFEKPALRAPRADAPVRPVLRLAPPACPARQIPRDLSVTAFKTYLACPFRFYLSRVLRMHPEDDGAREIDPMGFGSLAHDVLSLLKNHPASADENAIQGLLLAALDSLAKKQFGSHPPLAVLVQLDSLRQRLRAAAGLHAASVREGWRIISAEETFEAELDGMILRARIDRIDRHLDDGRIRILDYKTTDAGLSPAETHYQARKKEWIDLQLPLYRFIYEQIHPKAPVFVGYFNLPKAATETHIAELDFRSKDGDLYSSALAAARAVIADIRAGKFWPPETLRPDYDDFALLFAGNPPLIEEIPT
jgi:ATP-dependent helicase/nuclease subunit B